MKLAIPDHGNWYESGMVRKCTSSPPIAGPEIHIQKPTNQWLKKLENGKN